MRNCGVSQPCRSLATSAPASPRRAPGCAIGDGDVPSGIPIGRRTRPVDSWRGGIRKAHARRGTAVAKATVEARLYEINHATRAVMTPHYHPDERHTCSEGRGTRTREKCSA